MEQQWIGERSRSGARSCGTPCLAAVTSNGHLLRFLQTLAHSEGWRFRAHLNSCRVAEALPTEPLDLLAIDVFLDDQSGFDLRSELRRDSAAQLAPIFLIAPGCASGEELARRLEVSTARFQAVAVDEEALAGEMRRALSRTEDSEAARVRLRYATFLQATGEACHSANQPLTSLICNLELLLRGDFDEATRARLKNSHDGAVQLMSTIRQLQRAKWDEEKECFVPVYLLPRRTDF
ncbi:MAG: hypothetical protein NTW86_12130 [Candidatus Sumerlaeota bacterium]|nr:hypothetical protein [Candidatus Sumerlaeota bacterium]